MRLKSNVRHEYVLDKILNLLSWTHQVVQTSQVVTVQEWQQILLVSSHKLHKHMLITSRRNRKCRTYFKWGNTFFVSIRMESWGLGFMFKGEVKELPAFITHYVTFMQVSHKAFGLKLSKSFISKKRSSFTSLDVFTTCTCYTQVLSCS